MTSPDANAGLVAPAPDAILPTMKSGSETYTDSVLPGQDEKCQWNPGSATGRRQITLALINGAAMLALAAGPLAGTEQLTRPNLLLIYTDDQGYGDVSALNPDSKFQTPNLDRLVREGMAFTDAHSPDTVCTPSRYGLLTGRYSWRTELKKGVMGAEGRGLIAEARTTLASLLRDSGYRTAMVGKWHLGMTFHGKKGSREWSRPVLDGPVDKGFDYFYGIPASMNYGVLTYIVDRRVLEPPTLWTRKKPNEIAISDYRITPPYDISRSGGELEVAPGFDDQEVLTIFTRRAVQWLDDFAAEEGDERFFLYVAYTSPHKPVIPIAKFRGKSAAGAYGDFMMETDAHVGSLLEALDRNDMTRDTLVLVTSDNGPETTYHERLERFGHASAGGLRGGKRDLYEGGHRVPFIVRWPAVAKPGERSSDLVCQTDVLATMAEILDRELGPAEGEDSVSFLPVLRGEQRPARPPVIHHSSAGYFAIRDGRWKLNMIRGSGGSLAPRFVEPEPGEPQFELYNLAADLAETTNVASQWPNVVSRLREEITRIVTSGRTTPGPTSTHEGPKWWKELTWLAPQATER